MAIDNQVRTYRKSNKLTQEQLAEIVSVSRQTIISLEKGSYVPSLELAFDLAIYFGVPIEELFQKNEKMGE